MCVYIYIYIKIIYFLFFKFFFLIIKHQNNKKQKKINLKQKNFQKTLNVRHDCKNKHYQNPAFKILRYSHCISKGS